MLEIDGAVSKERSVFTRSPTHWRPDQERADQVTRQRYAELAKMKDFVELKSCYMKFIAETTASG